MVMVFYLKSNTAPISCKVCLPMIRSYNGCRPPLGYSNISGHRCTFLLAEQSMKKSLTSPTCLVLKLPLEVLHDSGTAILTTGMYLLDPFSKKRRSPLDPVSRRTLMVLCQTTSLSLASSSGGWASFIRSAKQDDVYGASNILLPCPGSQVIFHFVTDVVIILKSSIYSPS